MPGTRSVVLSGVFAPGLSAATYAGRPVRAVLEELQRPGLTLVYNDVLVPADLRVLAEPAARSGIPLLNEILAPHGLTTQAHGRQHLGHRRRTGGKPAQPTLRRSATPGAGRPLPWRRSW